MTLTMIGIIIIVAGVLIATIAVGVKVLVSIKEVHTMVNTRLDQLLLATRNASMHEGRDIQRVAEEKERGSVAVIAAVPPPAPIQSDTPPLAFTFDPDVRDASDPKRLGPRPEWRG